VNFSRQKIFKAFFGGIFQKLNKIQKQHKKLKKKSNQNLLSFYNVVRNHKYSVLIQPSLKSLPHSSQIL